MWKRRIAIWTVALLSLVAGASRAEKAKEKPLKTVVVTGTRIEQPIEQASQSIEVIGNDEIEARREQSVSELLRDVAGVDVVTTGSPGNATSVFIRGSDSDQVLVMIDGVEVNSPTLGQFNFATLTTDNIERIEVLRGAGGTLYGSEAVGGVINVITKRGAGDPRASLSMAGGNEDALRSEFTYAGGHGPLGVTASLSYLTMAGYRDRNDDHNNLASSVRADLDLLERGTLRGFFRSVNAKQGLVNNLYFLDVADPNARFEEDRYLGKGEWEHEPTPGLTYALGGSYVETDEEFSDPDAGAFFSRASNITTQITTSEAKASYFWRDMSITTLGGEFQEQTAHVRTRNVDADGTSLVSSKFDANRSNVGGYVQQQMLLLDERLVATGGVRVDSDENFGEEVSPSWSVGYLHHWEKEERWSTRVKGGYAEGFKAPSFNELFFPNFGNPDLDPETSSEWNGGFVQRLWGEEFTIDATYFYRRTSDLIQAICDPVTFMCQAQNFGRVDVDGVETGVTLRPLENLALRGTYTYLDWDVSPLPPAFAGGSPRRIPLLRRPHHRAAATVRYGRESIFQPADAVSVVLNANYVGERKDYNRTFAIDNNDDHVVVDLVLSYRVPGPLRTMHGTEFFSRINNLFDKQYEEAIGFQAPPINFLAGVRFLL